MTVPPPQQPLTGNSTKIPTPQEIEISTIRQEAKVEIYGWWKSLEAKIGQKGLWLILAIVLMLVVMKVCF